MTINVRGTLYQENLNNDMGLEFYDLSHPWGLGQPCWPYFEDVKIERLHNMARSGVLTQKITTAMHSGTHIDAPAHVAEGTAFMDEVPLPHFFVVRLVAIVAPTGKYRLETGK
jgi:kynurenine formamidase